MARALRPIGPAPQIKTGWPKTRPERWIPPKATEMGSTRAAVENDMVSGILRAQSGRRMMQSVKERCAEESDICELERKWQSDCQSRQPDEEEMLT
jgi:hypothetical protein